MASNNIQLASGSGTGQNTRVLSNVEAQQLLQRLRAAGAKVGDNQTIKIQAIQTNPTTGVRQIVAIPIQTSSAAASPVSSSAAVVSGSPSTVTYSPRTAGSGGSPYKVIRVPAGSVATAGAGGTQVVTMSPAQLAAATAGASGGEGGLPSNVKVVKIPAGSAAASAFQTGSPVSLAGSPATGYSVKQGPYIKPPGAQILTPTGVGTPGGGSIDGGGMIPGSRKRSGSDAAIDFDAFSSDSKRRKTEKGGKGLRHFSMKVCEKVQAKGSTSYNEVADELVNELTDPGCSSPTDQQYDQKNIRRRVYDALNVLMAMNIISKEKKEIKWLGLPTNSVQEANGLEIDKTRRIERIKAKTQQLQDLILQQIAFKNLVERNKDREKSEGAPPPNSSIQLPFIIVNTSKETVIDCSISNDKREYLFNFDDTFEIHDDMEVLKRMGLGFGLERGQVRAEDLERAKKMVPRALEQYVTQLAEKGPGSLAANMPKVSSPKVLREASEERLVSNRASNSLSSREAAEVAAASEAAAAVEASDDEDSEVDIN